MIDVSVVMSVYNGAKYLKESVESILSQEGVNFEFIVINDGSTDETPIILEEYAKEDNRIHILHQKNQGLTKALMRGCTEAKGEFIARQDCGDVSLPGRLKKQWQYFQNHPDIALLSCWAEAIGPEGEQLYINERHETPGEATRLLKTKNLKELKGVPHHATTMFKRELYERVGGYRWQFYYAQDLDLWRRMTNYGLLDFVPEVLYQFNLSEDAISFCMRDFQIATAKIILELTNVSPDEEKRLLGKVSRIFPKQRKMSKLRKANGYYFWGCLYRDKGENNRAVSCFKKAVLNNPLLLNAWWNLFRQLKQLH